MLRCAIMLGLMLLSLAGYAQKTKHVFYLHGAIVEGTTTDPVSKQYGTYEYSKIIDTFSKLGYEVHSEIRPANTDVSAYAKKLAGEIYALREKGVASKDIIVVGASKGALIAMLASGIMKDMTVKYVIMAACNDYNRKHYPINLYGTILSIYEESDDIGGTCAEIKITSAGVGHYKEIMLTTDLGHGFFYRPMREWLKPTIQWIEL